MMFELQHSSKYISQKREKQKVFHFWVNCPFKCQNTFCSHYILMQISFSLVVQGGGGGGQATAKCGL